MSISFSDISIGKKLGDGAQGIVYKVSSIPGVKLPFPVVYKEFKADVSISPILLENLIRFRKELNRRERTFLDERTTWPVEVVKKGSSTVGYLMRLLSDDYFINLNSPSGAKRKLCEIQLLKKAVDTFREDHGISVSPADRVRLAYELSRIYNFLHSHELIYGDLNWRNAIWSLSSGGFFTLLDCDGIRKKGVAGPSKQMHSPHWTPPGQKSVQSVETDRYKLALAILRILSPGLNSQFQGSAVSHFKIASSFVSKDLISLLRGALDPSTRREEIPTAGEFQRQLKAENENMPAQVKIQKEKDPPARIIKERGGTEPKEHIPPSTYRNSGAPATTAFNCSGCVLILGVIFLLVLLLYLVSDSG